MGTNAQEKSTTPGPSEGPTMVTMPQGATLLGASTAEGIEGGKREGGRGSPLQWAGYTMLLSLLCDLRPVAQPL